MKKNGVRKLQRISSELDRARKYESQAEAQVTAEERPLFHLSPRTGWMNDPNGFSFYRGRYHLFYQYYPYNTHWGAMHWGHAVSDDLIRWEYLPAALAPDEPYDRDGCWSGNALELSDGRQLLMYTGFVRDEKDIAGRGVQSQNIAVGDGVDYVKYSGNPVISEADLPEGVSRFDFRDPKLWELSSPDGKTVYCAAAALRYGEECTQIVRFKSEDAFKWSYDGVIAENRNVIGLMWECPDVFELDGEDVLIVSAMDMLPQGAEFHSGNNSIYIIGEDGIYRPDKARLLDCGIDFYAAQTIESPDKRRIMVAWMQNPDTANLRTRRDSVFGQMTIPRELRVSGGRIYQSPIRELEKYRRGEVSVRGYEVCGEEKEIEGICGRLLDMTIEIEPLDTSEPYREMRMKFAASEDRYTELRVSPEGSGVAGVSLDRKFSGQRRAVVRHRDLLTESSAGRLKLRLILDRYSAELFINDGADVMTMTFITEPDADRIFFASDGGVRLNITKYEIC